MYSLAIVPSSSPPPLQSTYTLLPPALILGLSIQQPWLQGEIETIGASKLRPVIVCDLPQHFGGKNTRAHGEAAASGTLLQEVMELNEAFFLQHPLLSLAADAPALHFDCPLSIVRNGTCSLYVYRHASILVVNKFCKLIPLLSLKCTYNFTM